MMSIKLDNRGEALVETLFAIIIIVLAVCLLFGSIITSSYVDNKAAVTDIDYYDFLSDADAQIGAGTSGTVHIQRVDTDGSVLAETDIPVTIYGTEGTYSYRRAP